MAVVGVEKLQTAEVEGKTVNAGFQIAKSLKI